MTIYTRINSPAVVVLAATALAFVITLGAIPEAYADESGDPANEESATVDRDAFDEFTREVIWSQSVLYSSGQTETAYFKGRHQRTLEGADLYEAIGQPELARSYNRRNRTSIALGTLGVLGTLGGVGLFLYGLTSPVGLTGLGISLGGLVAIGVGASIDPHPIESHETRELIEEYNLELLDRLEIDRRHLPDDDDDMPDGDLYVSPYFNDDGGGLALQLTF